MEAGLNVGSPDASTRTQALGVPMTDKKTTPSGEPLQSSQASLWTSSPPREPPLPSLSTEVTSAAIRQIRKAVQAAEAETKRFEGHVSDEAMKRSCG